MVGVWLRGTRRYLLRLSPSVVPAISSPVPEVIIPAAAVAPISIPTSVIPVSIPIPIPIPIAVPIPVPIPVPVPGPISILLPRAIPLSVITAIVPIAVPLVIASFFSAIVAPVHLRGASISRPGGRSQPQQLPQLLDFLSAELPPLVLASGEVTAQAVHAVGGRHEVATDVAHHRALAQHVSPSEQLLAIQLQLVHLPQHVPRRLHVQLLGQRLRGVHEVLHLPVHRQHVVDLGGRGHRLALLADHPLAVALDLAVAAGDHVLQKA
eukprot:scaffold2618_cov240-Pinguiococcus_pyrenoidosus.AAC.10